MNIFLAIFLFTAMAAVLIKGFLQFYPGIGRIPDKKMYHKYAGRTSYFSDGRFENQKSIKTLTNGKDEKGNRLIPSVTLPAVKTNRVPEGEEGKLYIYWLGHSSILVQLGKKNILIDPVLSKFASPIQFMGPKRFSEIPIETENLPPIDILLLSHDHYDHTDRDTILAIDQKVKKYIVPLGMESYLDGWGIQREKILTTGWYENLDADDITITATPSQHFSGRNPLKARSTWWCGYVIQDESHSVYYTGDGGYSNEFRKIGERFPSIDLALVECGQYGNCWPTSHMFPEQTVQAVIDLQAKWCIPVHWGAYCICNNNWDDSILRFTAEATRRSVSYATPLLGERVDFAKIEKYNKKWWEAYK